MKLLLQLWVILLCMASPAYAAPVGHSLETIPLTITTSDGKDHIFQVEVARKRAKMTRGLMFREQLGDKEGMLFLYTTPKRQSMWMKNTLIPLDILFIRSDGTISSIHHNAQPHSLEHIYSQEAVSAVLELKGGSAEKLRLEPNNKIKW